MINFFASNDQLCKCPPSNDDSQAFIHERARNLLDISLPLKKQAQSKIEELREAVGGFTLLT